MIFPMWPEFFRERAERWQETKHVNWICLCAGLASWVLNILCRWDIFVIPGFLLPVFAFFMWRQQVYEKDNVLLKVRIGENGVDVINSAGDVVQSTEYSHVRKMEIRRVRLSQNHKGSRYQGEPIDCELIFLYIDETYNFADLKLKERYIYHVDDKCYYDDEDIFFHHGCIAFDYNEDAWRLLQQRID